MTALIPISLSRYTYFSLLVSVIVFILWLVCFSVDFIFVQFKSFLSTSSQWWNVKIRTHCMTEIIYCITLCWKYPVASVIVSKLNLPLLFRDHIWKKLTLKQNLISILRPICKRWENSTDILKVQHESDKKQFIEMELTFKLYSHLMKKYI